VSGRWVLVLHSFKEEVGLAHVVPFPPALCEASAFFLNLCQACCPTRLGVGLTEQAFHMLCSLHLYSGIGHSEMVTNPLITVSWQAPTCWSIDSSFRSRIDSLDGTMNFCQLIFLPCFSNWAGVCYSELGPMVISSDHPIGGAL
jgi:hypothetical protein